MSKLAILNDSHWGVRNGSDVFMNHMDKFFNEVFFPYCKKHGIKRILHLGDFFDHRRFINIKVLNRVYTDFIMKLTDNDMTMDIICGNHDVYYKNTNNINSLEEILNGYDRIKIHMTPKDLEVGNLTIGLIPWITASNYDDCMEFIQNSRSDILGAHLELNGFKMMKGGGVASHGMDPAIFSRFEMVLSGHFHTKSERDNIHYLGTQYELTWSDAGDPKYFHILDTETRELTPIRNNNHLFQRIRYDDIKLPVPPDREKIENSYVKVVVINKKDLYGFDKFIDYIQSSNPIDIKIVETFDEYSGENANDENISTVDTPTLLNTYVDSINTNLDLDKLKKTLYELYLEARDLQAI